MIKEIGSTFYLDPKIQISDNLDNNTNPNILMQGESYLSTCRSCIGLCLDQITDSNKVALLPSFTCESVLAPFLSRGYKVHPYPITADLSIDWDSFYSRIKTIRPSVILVHSYFGFNTTESIREKIYQLKSEGYILIEDMTQSMFSSTKPLDADFHVGSIRKWLPIPDGAFTTAHTSATIEDNELAKAKLLALKLKGEYILNGRGEKALFRSKFNEAEAILDSRSKPYSMSRISKTIFNQTDIKEMIEVRRNNYRYLLNLILQSPLLSKKLTVVLGQLPTEVCPFHLPVFVKENRKALQTFLAGNDIYATIIWACPKEFSDLINIEARYIYDNILCFHVDQRYGITDMRRIVNVLTDFYSA